MLKDYQNFKMQIDLELNKRIRERYNKLKRMQNKASTKFGIEQNDADNALQKTGRAGNFMKQKTLFARESIKLSPKH